MTERRRFMRFKTMLDVFHRMADTRFGKSRSVMRDLSKDGLRLSADSELERGTLVELEMSIPGDNLPVFAFGEVAWSAKTTGSEYDSGVRFTKIKNNDRARLLDYVYEEWIKLKKKTNRISEEV